MVEIAPYLCDGCPAKGNGSIDFDVNGAAPYSTADSFRQTRTYALEDPDSYTSDNELAEASSRFLRYYDPETDEFYEKEGDFDAALLGVACIKRFIAGECQKTRSDILRESDID
jgi:hypothetical protein